MVFTADRKFCATWEMPCLHIYMNIVLTAAQKQDAVVALSKITARATSKPEDYVQVILQDGAATLFAGTAEKTAFVDLHSIGSISRQKNKGTSADVTKYLTDSPRVGHSFTQKLRA
jgi:phenylpyruvate tautomerase PptA (4-oxalocrotonate tautomerase family)